MRAVPTNPRRAYQPSGMLASGNIPLLRRPVRPSGQQSVATFSCDARSHSALDFVNHHRAKVESSHIAAQDQLTGAPMDGYRGQDQSDDDVDGAYDDEHGEIETPPFFDNQERRMHVRAYNYWVSLLGSRVLPSIEDLNPEDTEDFAANSVLLDFSLGLEDPAILYLGSALRAECGITGPIARISEVPPRSLLSRLTDHYLQIIANAAPVGFEAEFTNQRDADLMYRGILMPFSSDDETIDFIYGVINWKEAASGPMAEQLDEEVRVALGAGPASDTSATIWADGPSATSDFDFDEADAARDAFDETDPMSGESFGFDELDSADPECQPQHAPPPPSLTQSAAHAFRAGVGPTYSEDDDFGQSAGELDLSEFLVSDEANFAEEAFQAAELTGHLAESEPAIEGASLPESVPVEFVDDTVGGTDGTDIADGLVRELEAARRSAIEVRDCDARSRAALYRAIGDAYDFALSARADPRTYEGMLEAAGIAAQGRAPMTAVIKLVFGADYEKTRIAEYALALDYGLERGMPRGALAVELGAYEGGLKGLVQDMRAARNGETDSAALRPAHRLERAVRKLGRAAPVAAADLPFGELGLAVVVARREADGTISLVAGVGLDDKAAQKIMVTASKTV